MAKFLFVLCRGQVLQTAVLTDLVVVVAPGFDQHGSLATRAEPFQRQTLVAELAAEAFVAAVLQRLAGVIERRSDATVRYLFQNGLADELRPVVRSHEKRRSMQARGPRQHLDYPLVTCPIPPYH